GELHEHVDMSLLGPDIATPPPIPTTAIYSRTDGIVPWRSCVQARGHLAESVEVYSSHMGLCVNGAALYAIADRLALPEGHWRPFDTSGIRQMFYGRSEPDA
ncbi:MAG TPA: hypothetical protein PK264_23255, partial [Hyphomicrobiaceae bacterium]|nr:hypothetical protein [Hyphomicrobiaceae bacterium]